MHVTEMTRYWPLQVLEDLRLEIAVKCLPQKIPHYKWQSAESRTCVPPGLLDTGWEALQHLQAGLFGISSGADRWRPGSDCPPRRG
jgi:hypothetical protein